MKTREIAEEASIMDQLKLNPSRQVVAAQCSGTILLAKLGLLGSVPACTDLTSKPWVQAAGIKILNQAFVAQGNIATAGGCLSAQFVSSWLIARLKSAEAAREVMHYFAPVGEKDRYVDCEMGHILGATPFTEQAK
jgi:transcriptional regulator GlxA family with amidase domain